MVGAVGMQSALVWFQVGDIETSSSNPINHYNIQYFKDIEFNFLRYQNVMELVVEENKDESLWDLILKLFKIGDNQTKNFFSSPHPISGIVTFEVKGLQPGKSYRYYLKGYKDSHGKFQTKPFWKFKQKHPPEFSFIIASCHYVNERDYDRSGDPYGGGYEIFRSIEKESASFFLWLGDNVYLREPDWDSPYGILRRYTHTRNLVESKNIFRNLAHFAIWDDHDFGPNDSSLSYSLSNYTSYYFKEFWPDFHYPKHGIYRSFVWGDAEFFLLDNRTFRTANKNKVFGKRTILGEKQLNWLFHALADSTAKIKFIAMGGQFLNSEAVYENYANYSEERDLILQTLKKLNLKNVFILSGDRHHSEVSYYSFKDSFNPLNQNSGIYEFTVSPLTAGVHKDGLQEKNKYRVEGSAFAERAYGFIQLTNKITDPSIRVLNYNLKNSNGESIYQLNIELD